MEPTRARPVPFCRHGFLPLPLTFARFFVLCVPRRSAAFACTTDSHIRSAFTRPPKTSSLTSTLPTFLFSLLTISSCICPVPCALLLALFRLLDLRDLDLLRRDRLADDHVAGRRAGDAALDDQQVIVAVDAHDFQVACRDALAAHPTGSAHALDHPRRERRGADRAGRAVEHRSVRRRAPGEVMALDDALEPFAAAGADDVDALAQREDRRHENLVA